MALTQVYGWPAWNAAANNPRKYRLDVGALQPNGVAGLSRTRGSFQLDATGLPAAQD